MEFAKIFITLAALINPFGAIPAFIGLTQGQSSLERRRTARTAALATVLVITVTALAGQYILAGFGITVPSLQVGGGVLLFIVAISMFNAQPAPSRTTPEETDEAAERANIAVVPLTIPLLTGPGTVSTVIIHSEQVQHWWDMVALLMIGAVMGGVVWVCFRMAGRISRYAGQTGLNIMTRLMGLVLAALAVEFVAHGVRTLATGVA